MTVLDALPLDGIVDALHRSLISDAHRSLRLRLSNRHGAVESVLLPQRIAIHERLGEGLSGTVTCLSTRAGIPLKTFAGLPIEVQVITARGSTRTLCGVVAQAAEGQSDGGLATYQLTVVDALALLRRDVTSRVFRQLSVVDISERLLKEARERSPALARAFDVDLSLLSAERYPKREFILQINESRTDFLKRLWKQAGIQWFVRPGAPGEGDDTPSHTLVLFDDGMRLSQNAAGNIRYHRDHATEQRDSIDLFTGIRQVVAGQVGRSSFDYLSGQLARFDSPTQAEQGEDGETLAAGLLDYRIDAPHLGDNAADYTRLGQLRVTHHELEARCFIGESGVRDLAVGEWFTLDAHPHFAAKGEDERQFIVAQVQHHAENNLPKQLNEQAQALFARSGWDRTDADRDARRDGGRYGNRFVCVERRLPIIPAFDPIADVPRPPLMMARVVGPKGEVVHCDVHGRIKVQFLGLRSEDHTHAEGVGTSDTDTDSAWVRWLSPWAGPDRGQFALPRAGDVVAIDFVGGHPDKPVVVGSLFGGPETPPDFSGVGELPGNRYLSGIKTQEVKGSGYNQLRLDDTTTQVSAQLSSTHAASQLNAGYLTYPRKDGEAEPRGEGVELCTDAAAAIRAARGLLLTTAAQPGADGPQLSRQELIACLSAAQQLAESLADLAKQQAADPGDPKPQGELKTAVEDWEKSSNTDSKQSGGGAPVVAVSAPAGLAITTPQSATVYTGQSLDLVTGDALQQSVGQRWIAQVGRAISWFVQGGKAATDVVVKLIAARGTIQIQAHDGSLEQSATESVRIEAGKKTLITTADGPVTIIGGGGCLFKMEGGNIDLHCPGTFTVKATAVDYQGGARVPVPIMRWNVGERRHWVGLELLDADTNEPVPEREYDIHFEGGSVVSGTLNAQGKARHDDVPDKRVEKVVYKPRQGKTETPPRPMEDLLIADSTPRTA